MRSYRSLAFPVTATMLLAGCEEQSAPVVGLGSDEVSADLSLAAPVSIPDHPVVRNVFDIESAPEGGPARSEHLGYGSNDEYYNEPVYDEAAGIWGAKTIAYFRPGYLSVTGSHDFVGNKGRIETRGILAYQGTVIGTDDSEREDSYPFLWPPWDVHSIWTQAVIYTDRECGQSGWGDSVHKAWWEAVFGGPAYGFSTISRTSNAERTYQPTCPPPPPPPTGSTPNQNTGGGGESVCYIWITYDIYSGEIYDQQLLYCTDGG